VLEVLTAEDLAYYRGFSKASSGPWFDNYEGMCRKTVLKRGLEFVPRSPLLVASLRETETGGYEIPEDMWEAAKLKASGVVSEQVLEQVEHEVTTGEVLRQPGED
jgi:recombinational DNA repair protein RecT